MRRFLCILPCLLACASLPAQEFLSQILTLTGETDAEALDERVLERFDALGAAPLCLNLSGRGALVSSGLFTPFQVASILDYRATQGDILSFTELALVDGFDASLAEALRPFVSLRSASAVGHPPDSAVRQRLVVRGAVASTGWNAGAKYRIGAGRFEGAGALNRPSAGGLAGGGYLRWEGLKWLGKAIAGDFNVRFGQGLVLWSSFSLSGVSTPESFARRPSGLAPAWSWNGTALRGGAADFCLGPLILTVCADVPRLRGSPSAVMPAANLSWYSRYGQCGVTTCPEAVSADGRYCVRGVDIFAEAAFDFRNKSPATVAGVMFPAGAFSLSALGRYYSAAYDVSHAGAVRSSTKVKDEAGVSLGVRWKDWSLTADAFTKLSAPKRGLKVVLAGSQPLGEHITLKIRIAERLRSYAPLNRTDVRADLALDYGRWLTNVRANAVFSKGAGLLAYAEQGFKAEKLALWLRLTLFRADNWDDRLYSYERDAPGTFNVPAYYGRGFALALTGSCKLLKNRLKIYARTALAVNTAKAVTKAEAKLQAVWDF